MARFLRWTTALVAASGLICGTASAGQIVYVSNSGSGALYAASDTGAGAHVLATADQVPGMGLISGATVQPNGTQVAFAAQWSGALAEVAKWPGVIQCGVYCVGAYKLVGGTATRLSPAPLSCGDHPCVEYEEAPEIATDGTVYVDDDFSQYTKTGGCSNWCYLTTMRRTTAYPADGSAPYHPALGCSDEDQFAEKYVAVDPRNSKRLLYANCADAQNGNFVLADSLGTLTTAADDAFLSEDDAAFAYPSFAPDGHAIAVILTGDDDEGLWTSSDNGAHWTERLALPDGAVIGADHWITNNELGIVVNRDLYRFNAACTTGGCSFPASTTKIATNVHADWGWTASTAAIAPLTQPSGGGGGGAGGGGTTTPTTPTPPAPVVPAPKPAPLITSLKPVGKATVRAGIRLRLTLTRAQTVKVALVRGKKALGTQRFSVKAGTHTITIKRAKGHRLSRGSYGLTVTAGAETHKLSVRVR